MDNSNEILGEDDYNYEASMQLKKSVSYQNFIHWCKINGVLFDSIEIPAAFGPLGIPGVAASEDIPANKAIAMVPYKLIMSLKKIQNGELKQVIRENPDLFNQERNQDAEFNTLAVSVLREKIKGKDSFFYDYLESVGKSYTMMEWTKEDVFETHDQALIEEHVYFVDEMMEVWIKIQIALKKYPEMFPPEKVTQDLFFQSYELVMTRCFGWSLPSTCLVPFADMFNHSCNATTHYIVHRKYEIDPPQKPLAYLIKQKKFNLDLLKEPALEQDEETRRKLLTFQTEKGKFIQENFSLVNEDIKNKIGNNPNQIESLNQLDKKKIVYQINSQQLTQQNQTQIWDQQYFTTTDSEDNDTEDDEKDARAKQFEQLKEKETKQLDEQYQKNELKKLNKQENSNQSQQSSETTNESQVKVDSAKENQEARKKEIKQQITTLLKQIHANEDRDEAEILKADDEGEEDEEEEEDDEEEETKEEKEENNSDSSEEAEWSWCDENDQNLYFTVVTKKPYKKGEQLYNCYGRRTNRFLLMWYGFVFQKNTYDSYPFRVFNFADSILTLTFIQMFMNLKSHALVESNLEKIVVQKFLYKSDWKNGVLFQGQRVKLSDLTKEFRLKKNKICIDLIVYLRVYLMLHYTGPDISTLMVTIPVSIQFEDYVLQFGLKVLYYLKSQFLTTIEEDEAILADLSINYKLRFATVLRYNYKLIIDDQIKLFKQALNIVGRIKDGKSLKEAYMENFEGFYTIEELIIERHKIKKYLLQLKDGFDKKVLNRIEL